MTPAYRSAAVIFGRLDGDAMGAADRMCQRCGNSLAGKRADARFCCAGCRVNSHRDEVGRVDAITALAVIDRPMRTALIEAGALNPQHEHDAEKLREAFALMCHQFAKKHA
ncbi:hypothetical protein [Mesorhizobium qingshengii]|uniref:Uncharacterized protein n=1 Tax=Mesorhizobium qingshengii TaxID=1165689 RepID=A0A1G5V303_9HYPH|nr:hypothetical protein [Mesorhizobium qingshengii]SDA40253.1 hypothetical protein SAMN02927914_00219 [Mesorhizobium qingshengii]